MPARTKRKALRASRPSRKSKAAAEAQRLANGKPARLSMELPSATHRALKMRAASEGQTIKDYILALLRQDGIPVPSTED